LPTLSADGTLKKLRYLIVLHAPAVVLDGQPAEGQLRVDNSTIRASHRCPLTYQTISWPKTSDACREDPLCPCFPRFPPHTTPEGPILPPPSSTARRNAGCLCPVRLALFSLLFITHDYLFVCRMALSVAFSTLRA
jgi:hypothetical protein